MPVTVLAAVACLGGCGTSDDSAGSAMESPPTSVEPDPVQRPASSCDIAGDLVRLDEELRAAEPFRFEKRDPLSVELRHALGKLRTRAYGGETDFYLAVFLPTVVLERADFSESGLLTSEEQDAVGELDAALMRYCGFGLVSEGLLAISAR